MNKDGNFLPSLNLPTFFIYHTRADFNSADRSSMQDICHTWTQL